MEETAPLNGTTIKDQAWKEKKGVGPWIMVAVLLLGLAAFYAGQMSGSSPVATRGGGGADASMMSYDAFESITNDAAGVAFTTFPPTFPSGSVLCPGQIEYCDCGFDCDANPSFCACDEAQTCCETIQPQTSCLKCVSGENCCFTRLGQWDYSCPDCEGSSF